MIMRESLYKDAHPLHKVSKKNFLFYFFNENPLTKNGKRNFYFIFLRENPLAKNGKKIKKRKKFRAKRKEGGESPLTIY